MVTLAASYIRKPLQQQPAGSSTESSLFLSNCINYQKREKFLCLSVQNENLDNGTCFQLQLGNCDAKPMAEVS